MATHNLLPSEPTNEQDAFENVFPLPEHCTRFEGGYAPTRYNAWSAQSFCDRWEGWKARAELTSSGQAAPDVEQEPVGYVLTRRLEAMDGVIDCDCTFMKNKVRGVTDKLTPLYTSPQPKREPCTVTRHEIREAMMYCEINHCENPDAYTLDILKRLGIGVK